ncbi:MAG: hypothetical protein QOF82_3139 [Frankiales bacterium]|nr:hypothetical protein [Frankiales bacterium]MDX6214052.1 hypothetical protein [Frankiales bacterium]MDX6223124.1 hypothetical protein [Frankiales bacterium]
MAIITETGVSNEDESVGHGVMGLLAAGIPLSLLMDLVDAGGPQSRDLVDNEVGDASWLGWSRSHAAGAA